MTLAQLITYLSPALLYAGTATALLLGLLHIFGKRVSTHTALTLYPALLFLTLTQHPFPDRTLLDCSGGGAQPILQPFATFSHVAHLWRQSLDGAGLSIWIGSKVVQAAVMNFLLPAAIGAAFARHTGRQRPWFQALGLAVFLSFGAEISQLTGVFGLYPCAYRQFEVDDLIFNISGLLAGFALMSRVSGREGHKA